MSQNQRNVGIALLLLSALVFSTAGLFTKGVSANAWDVIFWRAFFAAIFTTGFIYWRGRSKSEFLHMGKVGWIVAAIGASGTAAFIPAFKLTSVANVSLIYASAPLLAAIFAWIWIKETMSWPAVFGCAAAFIGVLFIVGGSLKSINLQGDMLALWMTIVLAAMMVIYRKFPETPSAGPSVVSCLFLLPPAIYFSNPFMVSLTEIAILSAFGLVFAFASVTLVEGAKRLPSGETALLSSLEAPFAIILAWIILFEAPPLPTILGGVLIMVGVFASQARNIKWKGEGKWHPQQN
ncbi:MAG: DMT family transporter [Pseudomonadota bacterium]